MPDRSSRRDEPLAPSVQAFALANELRGGPDRSEHAIGDFVTHGLLSILKGSGPSHSRWVPDRLPSLAQGLMHLGYWLRHRPASELADLDDDEMTEKLVAFLRAFVPERPPVLRGSIHRVAAAALADHVFMLALAKGERSLPTADEVEEAIALGLDEADGGLKKTAYDPIREDYVGKVNEDAGRKFDKR